MHHVPVVSNSPVPRRVRTPNWLDLRLVTGIVLVLASVVIGAKVIASSDSTERMWSASRDLAAGSVLTAGDLTPVRVRLPDGDGSYLPVHTNPVGSTLNRALVAGELVPQSALAQTDRATTVTVPLTADDAPKISRGQRIEL